MGSNIRSAALVAIMLVFTGTSLAAQQQRSKINGVNHTYFCGAYWYNGFHEDGAKSAVDVAALLGVDY